MSARDGTPRPAASYTGRSSMATGRSMGEPEAVPYSARSRSSAALGSARSGRLQSARGLASARSGAESARGGGATQRSQRTYRTDTLTTARADKEMGQIKTEKLALLRRLKEVESQLIAMGEES